MALVAFACAATALTAQQYPPPHNRTTWSNRFHDPDKYAKSFRRSRADAWQTAGGA